MTKWLLRNTLGKSTSWYKSSSRRTSRWYWNDAEKTGRRTAEFVNIVFIIFRIFVKFSLLDSIISSFPTLIGRWLSLEIIKKWPMCIVLIPFVLYVHLVNLNLPSNQIILFNFDLFPISDCSLAPSPCGHHCLALSGFACSKRYGLQHTQLSNQATSYNDFSFQRI